MFITYDFVWPGIVMLCWYICNLRTLFNTLPDSLNSNYVQCLSGAEVLSQYGLSNLTHLGEAHLHDICPALLNQAVLPSCPDDALMPEVRAVVIDARGECGKQSLNVSIYSSPYPHATFSWANVENEWCTVTMDIHSQSAIVDVQF